MNYVGIDHYRQYSQMLLIDSEACRNDGCSQEHFYDIKQAYEKDGIQGRKVLEEKQPRKASSTRKNRSLLSREGDRKGKKAHFLSCLVCLALSSLY